jgi:TetR/AcrR family transcriptional regulator
MMTPTRKPTAERKEEILDAAARVLARDGVASLTMATLAQEVGVTTGALFRHFDTRDAILVALAERTAAQLRADLAAPSEQDASAALRSFVAARMGTVAKIPSAPMMVLSPDVHLALPTKGREALAATVRETFDHVAAIVARGQAEGAFRQDLSPRSAAGVVLGALALRALQRVVAPRTLLTEHPADTLLTLLSSTTKKAPSSP